METIKAKTLIAVDTNAKTVKGQTQGYNTGIMYLAPAKLAGEANLCGHASPACVDACLNTSGLGGVYPSIQLARINKALYFIRFRAEFMAQVNKEVGKLSKKYGPALCVRLNGTSDIPFNNIRFDDGLNIMEKYSEVQFYDYSKDYKKVINNSIPNYHLTYSVDERAVSSFKGSQVLKSGKNIAVVVSKKLYNELFGGKNKAEDFKAYITNAKGEKHELINGDLSDLRFLDRKGIVILRAKGKANTDRTGFVKHDIFEIIDLTEL
jgi:hypothetical protein